MEDAKNFDIPLMKNFKTVSPVCDQNHNWANKLENKLLGEIHDCCTRAARAASHRLHSYGARSVATHYDMVADLRHKCICGEDHQRGLQSLLEFGPNRCRLIGDKPEKCCHKILTHLFPKNNFVLNIRTFGYRVEPNSPSLGLDIYCDSLRLALEINNGFLLYEYEDPIQEYNEGDHNRAIEHIKSYDTRQVNACRREGIRLISIVLSDVSQYRLQIDQLLTAKAIWNAVAVMQFPEGTHLGSLADLLAML